MEVLASACITRLFDSVMLERIYSADYTTIYHCDCNFTFGAAWPRKYSYANGYISGAKYYTCPDCGHFSNPSREKILFLHEEREVVPISLFVDVLSYKNFIDLKIKYYGISLTFDGRKIDHGMLSQTLRFDFKRRMAIYIDPNKNKHEVTIEYLRRNDVMPILRFLGRSYAMKDFNKSRLNSVFKSLRLEFEDRIKSSYGFEAKNVYIAPGATEFNGYHHSMLLNMILKVAAPDMPAINTIFKNTSTWFNSYGLSIRAIPFDDDVLDLTRQGINFHEALRRVHMAPNSRALRQAMIKDPLYVLMANVLNLFNDENCRRTILTLDRYPKTLLGNDPYDGLVKTAAGVRDLMRVTTQDIRMMWLSLIQRFGEASVLKWILNTASVDVRDSIEMYSKLQPEARKELWGTKFRLRSFHEVLINIFNKQEYGDMHLPMIPALSADLNGLHFAVPKTAAELMIIGKKLRNCVGSYRDQVMNGNTAIVVVTNDRMQPVACLELRKDQEQFTRLVQAKLFGNQCVSRNRDINGAVLEWANKLKIEPCTIDIDAQVS